MFSPPKPAAADPSKTRKVRFFHPLFSFNGKHWHTFFRPFCGPFYIFPYNWHFFEFLSKVANAYIFSPFPPSKTRKGRVFHPFFSFNGKHWHTFFRPFCGPFFIFPYNWHQNIRIPAFKSLPSSSQNGKIRCLPLVQDRCRTHKWLFSVKKVPLLTHGGHFWVRFFPQKFLGPCSSKIPRRAAWKSYTFFKKWWLGTPQKIVFWPP